MATTTSVISTPDYPGKVLKRVHCNVNELSKNLPLPPEDSDDWPPALNGQTKKQVDFAAQIRAQRLPIWQHDLPANVLGAVETIVDACWWIAHKNAEAAEDIGWPSGWVGVRVDSFECPYCGITREDKEKCQNPKCRDHNGRMTLASKPSTLMQTAPSSSRPLDQVKFDEFESFARKAAMSPELAYLTIMAFFYRQTKDGRVLAKFMESYRRVEGHLQAINQILGSPGSE